MTASSSDQELRQRLQQLEANEASAPADLDATLPQIAAAAKRLCLADHCSVRHVEEQTARTWDDVRSGAAFPIDPKRFRYGSFVDACISENRVVEVAGAIDQWAAAYPLAAEINRSDGRCELAALAVPMPGRDGPIGAVLFIRNGTTPSPRATGPCWKPSRTRP